MLIFYTQGGSRSVFVIVCLFLSLGWLITPDSSLYKKLKTHKISAHCSTKIQGCHTSWNLSKKWILLYQFNLRFVTANWTIWNDYWFVVSKERLLLEALFNFLNCKSVYMKEVLHLLTLVFFPRSILVLDNVTELSVIWGLFILTQAWQLLGKIPSSVQQKMSQL